jgi:hypothetical protein
VQQGSQTRGWTKLFYGWDVRPDRDETWYEERRAEADDVARFEKEYPRDEDEALAPARTLVFFSPETLLAMRQDLKPPIKILPVGAGFYANIFQDFQIGKRYAAGTDTSHGVGQDFSVTCIIDAETGYTVADVMSPLMEPEQLSVASMDLLEYYRNPIWGIEDNDWGIQTIKVAIETHYPRIFYREEGKPGWHTADTRQRTGSRFVLWGDLQSACNTRAITIPSEEGLAQFYSVIRNPDKHGRIEAQQGAHDDYPFAIGIANQIRDRAQRARVPGQRDEPRRTIGIDGEDMTGRNFPPSYSGLGRMQSRPNPYGW